MQPKKVDTFEKIKWEKLKEKDAIHYSKTIKNEFFSHLSMSKIANDLFGNILKGLELILKKLNISSDLKGFSKENVGF